MNEVSMKRLSVRNITIMAALVAFMVSMLVVAFAPAPAASAAANRYWSKLYNTKAQCEASRKKHTTHWTRVGRCEPIGAMHGNKPVTHGYQHLIYLRYGSA